MSRLVGIQTISSSDHFFNGPRFGRLILVRKTRAGRFVPAEPQLSLKQDRRNPRLSVVMHLAGMETHQFLARVENLVDRKLVSRQGPDENIEISTEGLEELVELVTPDEEEAEERREGEI